MKNYIRGGQIALHFYRMFSQVNAKVLKVALLAFLLSSSFLIYRKTTEYERSLFLHYYYAELHQAISGKNARYQFLDSDGRRVVMKVANFLNHPSTQYYRKRCIKVIQKVLIEVSIYTGLGIVLFVMVLTLIGQWH